MRFYSETQLGKHQSLTPEGFLLVIDVPLARTGSLLYAEGEVPVTADQSGIIRVTREASEVFNPIAIASFAGKPVTNDHPPMKVSPGNWREYSVGVVLDPRQGDGIQYDRDFLYADLLITDEKAIEDVREGKVQVSAGYDAEYEELRPGEGRQHRIVGNHVALVDKGRCGPRCAIGDREMPGNQPVQPAWVDRIMHAHMTGDKSALVNELAKVGEMLGTAGLSAPAPGISKDEEEVPTKSRPKPEAVKDTAQTEDAVATAMDAVKSAVNDISKRMDNVERAIAIMASDEGPAKKTKDAAPVVDAKKDDEDDDDDEDDKPAFMKKKSKDAANEATEDTVDEEKAPAPAKDKKATTGDSAPLALQWQEVISRAEFLAPGIKHPTFDAAKPPNYTMDAMCTFRRKVLAAAMKEDDTAEAVTKIAGAVPDLKLMTCDTVAMVFNGASELMRHTNSNQPVGGMNYTLASGPTSNQLADINAKNRKAFGLPV